MGPRLFSRGMIPGPGTSACGSWRFNGAATFQPRNVGPSVFTMVAPLALQWGRDFSAAECNHLQVAGRQLDRASMGPRLFSRGMVSAAQQIAGASGGLQWGRDFSAAE